MKVRKIISLVVLGAMACLLSFSPVEAAKYRMQQRIRVPGGQIKTVTKVRGPARLLRRSTVSTQVVIPQPCVNCWQTVYYYLGY